MYVLTYVCAFSAIILFFRVPVNVLAHTPAGKLTPGWESLD